MNEPPQKANANIPQYFAEYLTHTDHRLVTKWLHYFEIYQAELGHLQGRDIRFLEIGVFMGGSIRMWQGYFGPGSTLIFADIDPKCAALAEPGTIVEVGDQTDPDFLRRLGETHGPFDVIIDDGGHKMDQQITSFENLWPLMAATGIYLVEDTHTSYWPGFGGGYREEASFIEYAKRLVDRMHSWYTDQDDLFPFDAIARELGYVRFYDSIVSILKTPRKDPPLTVESVNGKITGNRRVLGIRGRKSVF